MAKMKIAEFKIDDINPAKYNPRVISDEAFAGLTASVSRFGCVEPIIVNTRGKKNVIVGGHQRYKAMKATGAKKISCVCVSLSVADEKLLNLSLNNPAIQGDFIDDLSDYIAEMRDSIDDGDYLDLMIGQLTGELADDPGLTDPDAVPDPPKKPKTKLGDLYILGDHRLLCGDSANEKDCKKLMGKEKADMVFTDPPYNVDYVGQKKMKMKNDKLSNDSFLKFLCDSFTNFYNNCKPGAGVYTAHADTEGFNFRTAFDESGFYLAGCLVWKKQRMVLGRSDYQWQHEPVLYGWKKPGTHFFKGGRKQTTILNETDVISKMSDTEYSIKTAIGEVLVSGSDIKFRELPTTVIEVDKPLVSKEHPTMKPVALITRFINNSSRKSALVLDLFLGSGSTMIAAESTGRRCFGMEIDPVYCDVIVERWQNFTGKKAKKKKTNH